PKRQKPTCSAISLQRNPLDQSQIPSRRTSHPARPAANSASRPVGEAVSKQTAKDPQALFEDFMMVF
ncbi:MAG: hypothetical protein ACK5IB_14240, partial [Qingshengfaniella sp.]